METNKPKLNSELKGQHKNDLRYNDEKFGFNSTLTNKKHVVHSFMKIKCGSTA